METNNFNLESNKPDRVHSSAYTEILIGILIGFVLGIISYTLFTSSNTQKETIFNPDIDDKKLGPAPNALTDSPNYNLISKHYISTDSKIYENTRLGYKIDYPRGVQIYDCPDYPCSSIEHFTIRLEPLRFYSKDEILNADLYCSADGPEGSVHCENPQILEFTNTLGVNGFSVRRLRVVESREFDGEKVVNVKTEKFNDIVYIFPLNGISDYKAILLSSDMPNEKNLKELEKIANSYRLSN